MPNPHIELRFGDNSVPEMKEAADKGKLHQTHHIILSALPGGMTSGRTSVALCIPLPDGSWVFCESSLRAFLAAAGALRARFGDEDGDEGEPLRIEMDLNKPPTN
jgi:hypothetical protein